MHLFPMFLKLDGRRCLIAGAGRIAEGKAENLLAAGAQVAVVAPEASPAVAGLARQGRILWRARRFEPADLDGVFLAIAATNDAAVNHAIYEHAALRNILCNTVDDPPFCDFYFPSVVARGDLQIAISTAGKSPAFAQRLRRELDAQLPHDLGPWLAALGNLRRQVLAHAPAGEPRRLLLHRLAQRQACGAANCPARKSAFDFAPEEAHA